MDAIREKSRKKGDPLERIDVLATGHKCASCGNEIAERFSATYQGDILCWECAIDQESTTKNGVEHTTDPAKVVLSESGLYHKSLCDYVINVATGCSHGCKFCYVPSTPNITARQDMLSEQASVSDGQTDWGSYLLYRDDLPERLARKLGRKQKWKTTNRGRGVVMISSGTDCYQDRRAAQITRGCIIELISRGFPVRILTRSPAVARDIDVFQRGIELSEKRDGELIRVGSSIPCLDDKQVKAIEPGAPPPSARLEALRKISQAGIPVYVSMSPTYPTQTYEEFDNLIEEFANLDAEVVFQEPINPRGGNFQMTIKAAEEAGKDHLADELKKISNDREYWVKYSIQQMQWAEELGAKHDVDVHVWPDKQVIKSVGESQAKSLKEQRTAVSPENIADPSLPS
ncbi:radical SAM domain-containing protein [Halococcus saccharolyticus DSM 5350]|uniref:Radical SAM domain-containing protein n=1 Tax=Halococcus saccharolyticus DSM 5350 TaxID=1227455 RepID=M0MFG6_9EURY|nr:radical SAM domain-containing protein [Halococcus saccharolyticus DSM 5350]